MANITLSVSLRGTHYSVSLSSDDGLRVKTVNRDTLSKIKRVRPSTAE